VSTGAITKFVKIPKSTSAILEGESLLNDASSLIIFRFALAAVITGQFVWHEATLFFLWMIIGGVGIGLLLGWIFVQAHKRLPTNAPSDITLTLIEPYFMYWIAEQLHSSGVLAVVAGGLFMSARRLTFLNSASRVRGYSVWESFVFVLNGIVFFIIGLDHKLLCCINNNAYFPPRCCTPFQFQQATLADAAPAGVDGHAGCSIASGGIIHPGNA